MFKAGGSVFGVFGNGYVQGYYNESELANDKKSTQPDLMGT